jgi:hypothetical protein
LNKLSPALEDLGGFVGDAAALFKILTAELGHIPPGFGESIPALRRFAHNAAARDFTGGGGEQERDSRTNGDASGQPKNT